MPVKTSILPGNHSWYKPLTPTWDNPQGYRAADSNCPNKPGKGSPAKTAAWTEGAAVRSGAGAGQKGRKRNDTWHELPCHPYPPQNTTFLCLSGCSVSFALASYYNTFSLLVTVSFSISLDIRSHFLIWGTKGSERFWSFLTGKVRKGCISGFVQIRLNSGSTIFYTSWTLASWCIREKQHISGWNIIPHYRQQLNIYSLQFRHVYYTIAWLSK